MPWITFLLVEFFTDTEFVTHISLLVQIAVVNSKREIVFSSYIHHGYATVEDIWRLALEMNGKPLVERQAKALWRAFGPPSQQKPRGESLNWLAGQWWLLKQQHPALMMAEWSTCGVDERIYRSTLGRAGFDIEMILPGQSRWLSALTHWKSSPPSLPVFTLSYDCSLFALSNLVWRPEIKLFWCWILFQLPP